MPSEVQVGSLATRTAWKNLRPHREKRYPTKGSESTENHIKYKDIALICERGPFWEIKLWNGFVYTLSQKGSQKFTYNMNRDLSRMTCFAIKRPVLPEKIGKMNWL